MKPNTIIENSGGIDAWFNARRVIDTGRRAAKPAPQQTPTPPATASPAK